MDSWKGYDIERGYFSEAFKQYLRDRGLYFEPSADGSWVHFEVKNADDAVDRFLKQYEERTRYVYEFPEGTSQADINLAKRLGLKYLGSAKYRSGAKAYYIEGTLAELKNFAYEAFGDYELHPDFLCIAEDFAGVDELIEAGYFEDGKYCGDKRVRLQGSKLKDSGNDSKVIEMAQQELDRLVEEEVTPIYFFEDGSERTDWDSPESQRKINETDEKATALCYLIKAYGGVPRIESGWDGLADGYDGPRKH